MKNTLTIDMTNSYAVDMLSNVDAGVGVNRVYIEVKCDLTKTNTIAFGGTTYTATSEDYILEIPQAQWVGAGNLIITLSDGTTTKSLTVHKLKAIDASVFLKRITDVEYTFKTSRNPTDASVGTLQEEVDALKVRMGAAENVNAEQTRDIETNAGNISTNATNITALQNGKVNNSEKGAANGVATLNGDGKVPESQLPSYVDDVLEYASRSAFPGTGETGKLYVAKDTNIVYRWSGTTYVAVSEADIATINKAGIVKPDGTTVTIDQDGTLHAQGGHKILDPEGTQLAQKTKLQFLNSEVQNVGDKTVVTPKGKADYEFETYQDMMDAIEDGLVEPDSTIYVMEGDDIVIPGSGSGGHIIEDASGTELTQRDILQFAGTLKATDDSTNEKTVISDAAEEVEWSVWNAMTEAQRDAYSAGKKIDIVNAPGADGTIDADLMDLLWTNSSPTAAFAAQTISLNLSGYESVKIVFRRMTADSYCITYEVEKNAGATYVSMMWVQNSNEIVRIINSVTDTGVNFGKGIDQSGADNNGYLVPLKIYGIKKTVNLKINAIASDVSTSANKCMMSDGETSVEDEITELKEDTGWIELVNASDRVVKYRAVRDTVFVYVFANISTPSAWTTLATLPSTYAPTTNHTMCMYNNNVQFGNVLVRTNGQIDVIANVAFAGQICYSR